MCSEPSTLIFLYRITTEEDSTEAAADKALTTDSKAADGMSAFILTQSVFPSVY